MFYSHEVLTSRKYGVATVWLIATLGSRTSHKKVSRKAISEVNITKTCETIAESEIPMALRLQSNLLYGVARVYSQQCGYMLADVEAMRNSIRAVLKLLGTSDLTAEGGSKARSDQLILRDDPDFLLELDFDLADFERPGLEAMNSFDRLSSTPSIQSRQRSSEQTMDPLQYIDQLVLPQRGSSSVGPGYGGIDMSDASAADVAGRSAFSLQPEQEGLQDDLGLIIEEDGNIVLQDTPTRRAGIIPSSAQNKREVTAREDLTGAGDVDQMADNHIQGEVNMTGDEPFAAAENEHLFQEVDAADQEPLAGDANQPPTSETASAALRGRQRPTRKIIRIDHTTELRTQELRDWNNEYVVNMQKETQIKEAYHARALAKKNAELWLLGNVQLAACPLGIFSGMQLLEALTGFQLGTAKPKRARNESESPESGRRVRSRQEPGDVGRDDALDIDEYAPVFDEEVEQGRAQPTPLEDVQQSSLFPWNQSTGSRRPTGLFGTAVSSSAGGGMQPVVFTRRGSRFTSASPLVGRGTQALPTEGEIQLDCGDFTDDLGITGDNEYGIYGAAAGVDTQTAADSQWVRSALDTESANFLAFVRSAMNEKRGGGRKERVDSDDNDSGSLTSITFEDLLPHDKNSSIVAAQGFLHVLALGTGSSLKVEQDAAFGPIRLQIS